MSTESIFSPSHSIMQDSLAAPAANDFAPGIEAAFPAQFAELDGNVECVAGQIPDFVRGTYYLNGPARFRIGDLPYRHWLDGDGMVSRMRIGADGVHFKSRYVRSTKYVSEQDAGRALFRTFGTSFSGSRLNAIHNGLENPVNVSVYPFADRLLAFGEQGLPWEMDPDTLETRGQFTFNGRLNDASPMAAHPKFDPETGEMFNFGIFYSGQICAALFLSPGDGPASLSQGGPAALSLLGARLRAQQTLCGVLSVPLSSRYPRAIAGRKHGDGLSAMGA